MKGSCVVCGAEFETFQKAKQTCSRPCHVKRINKISGRESFCPGLPNGTVGALTEMTVAAHMMRKGYDVFRALSPSCYCDLVATKDNITFRVECRTGYRSLSTGSLSFPKTLRGAADLFAVYIPPEDTVFFLSPDGRTQVAI